MIRLRLCLLALLGAALNSSFATIPILKIPPDHLIYIGIVPKAQKISLTPEGGVSLHDSDGKAYTLKPGKAYSLRIKNGHLKLGTLTLAPKTLLKPVSSETAIKIGRKRYVGNLIVRLNGDGTLTAVDELSIEQYLLGVLPKEVDPNWPIEALKAQAVVARTFAYAQLGKYSRSGFDLTADTRSQMFGGLSEDWPSVRQAVTETRGEVLGYNGKLLDVYYHACCGGHTEDEAAVWEPKGSKSPEPLRGVKDPYCRHTPYSSWTVKFAGTKLERIFQKLGVDPGSVEKIKIDHRDRSGYVQSLAVKVSGSWWRVSSQELRRFLGAEALKSLRIGGIQKTREGFTFYGNGSGHGVGFCQWGARAQAKIGRGYEDILHFYFPSSVLSIING